jgi:hypothetical protein
MVRWLKCARVISLAGILFLSMACVSSQGEFRDVGSALHFEPSEAVGVIGIVDRTEGGFAVVEAYGRMEDVPLSWFSVRPVDGDVVEIFREEEKAEIDGGATEKSLAEVRATIELLVDAK